MKSLSVSTHRGLIYWQGLLLAVSLLIFWCLPTTTQFASESISAGIGMDVLLKLHDVSPNAQGFRWYRGGGTKANNRIIAILKTPKIYFLRGPGHRGRERIFSNGSLLIKNITMKDNGMFTVVAYLPNNTKEIAFGWLNIYELVKIPSILASNTKVTENKDAVFFTCETNETYIRWLYFGKKLQLSDRMKLSQDHKNLTIDPVKRDDAGIYQCEVTNPISSIDSWAIWLRVNHQ